MPPIPPEQAHPKKPAPEKKQKPGWDDKVIRVANRRLRKGWEQATGKKWDKEKNKKP